MIVEIEGKGTMEFPDGTDPAIIDMVVKRDFFGQTPQTTPTFTAPEEIEGISLPEATPMSREQAGAQLKKAFEPMRPAVMGVPIPVPPIIPRIIGEPIASAATGIPGFIAGTGVGIGDALRRAAMGKEKPISGGFKTGERVAQALTYQPKSELAGKIAEGLMLPVTGPITTAEEVMATGARAVAPEKYGEEAESAARLLTRAGVIAAPLLKGKPKPKGKAKLEVGAAEQEAMKPLVPSEKALELSKRDLGVESEAIKAGDFRVGDTFSRGGEPFTVTKKGELGTAYFANKQGKEFRLPENEAITIEKGSFKPVKQEEAVLPEQPTRPAPKEPWEMTRKNFTNLDRTHNGKPINLRQSSDLDIARTTWNDEFIKKAGSVLQSEGKDFSIENEHYAYIKTALSEGKSVPPEVLADYPELKGMRPSTKQSAQNMQRMAKEREAKVFQETQEKFAAEAASTETISAREARRKAEAALPQGDVKAGGLAYGQELPKYAGPATGINLKNIETTYDVKKFILNTAEKHSTEMFKGKQGKQTFEQIQEQANALAESLGERPQKIISAYKGKTENLAGYMKSANDLMTRSAEESWTGIKQALSEYVASGFKDESKLKVANDLGSIHAHIMAEVGGGNSKIARALGAMRMKKQPSQISNIKNLMTIFGKEGLTKEQIIKLSEISPTDTVAINTFIRNAVKPRFKDYFWSWWYNSVLSSPTTHAVNIINNALWMEFQRPVKAVTAAIDILVSKLQGRPREYYFRELMPKLGSFNLGLKKGLVEGLEIMKGKEIGDFAKLGTELETAVQLAPFSHSPSKAIRKVAPIIEAPTRALAAEDLVAKQVAFETHLHELAIRQAIKEGALKTGKDFYNRRVADIITEAPEGLVDQARNYAKYATFTDDAGKLTQAILKMRESLPLARLYLPFVRTIANITKRGVEMTPGVGLVMMRKQLKGPELSQALAKQAVGSAISYYFLQKYMNGDLTGATPRGTAEKENFYRSGKQPWSVRYGDKWLSLRKLDPFSTPIATIAIMGDAFRDNNEAPTDEQVTAAALGFANYLRDSSMLRGLSDMLTDMERGERNPQQMYTSLARPAAGLVPASGLLRSTTRAVESATEGQATLKNPRGAVEMIKSTFPLTEKDIRPKYNLWGEPIVFEGGPVRQYSPYKWTTETKDKVNQETYRLKLNIGMPQRKVFGIDLNEDQYEQYLIDAGQSAKKQLDVLVNSPRYDKMPDMVKEKTIRAIVYSTRKVAAVKLLKSMDKEKVKDEFEENLGLKEVEEK